VEEQHYIDETGKGVACDKCGGTYYEGEFPFCKGSPADHGKMHGFDEAFEPYVDIQLLSKKDPRCTSVNEFGQRGVPINSRSERRALMKAEGLQYGSQKFDTKRGKIRYVDQGSTRNKGF
jgi:hypothetical protein